MACTREICTRMNSSRVTASVLGAELRRGLIDDVSWRRLKSWMNDSNSTQKDGHSTRKAELLESSVCVHVCDICWRRGETFESLVYKSSLYDERSRENI